MADTYKITIKSNVPVAEAQMKANISSAMYAVSEQALGCILDTMENGYHDVHYRWNGFERIEGSAHTNIRDTGDLQRLMATDVDVPSKVIRIGSSLPYAVYVHEGTSRLKGRPFLVDGITRNLKRLQDVYTDYLTKGF